MQIIDIHHEHIEEVAFLYDQRNNIMSEPGGDLEYQSEIEERLEAHIDGLELGGEDSRPILKGYLDSDDEAEFFTAVYSLIRMGEAEENEVMDILEKSAISFSHGLCNASRFVDSDSINERLLGWLISESYLHRAVAVEVSGYNHYSQAIPFIESLLMDDEIEVKTAAMKAANRIDPGIGRKTAYSTLIEGENHSSLIEESFINLFIQQEKTVFQVAMQYCEGIYPFHPTASILLGLRGNSDDLQLLHSMLKTDKIDRSIFQAIGFTGRIDLLEMLIPLEKNPEYRPFIQEASHLILGTDPPEFEDEFEKGEEQENKGSFCLSEILSSIDIPRSDWQWRYRLGKPLKRENEREILTDIAAIYRRWLYLEICYKERKGIEIEYDDMAEKQYSFFRA